MTLTSTKTTTARSMTDPISIQKHISTFGINGLASLFVVLLMTAFITGQTASVSAQDDNEEKIAELMQEGQSYLGISEFAQAVDIFDEVIELDAKNALAWQLKGYALHVSGKLDEAIKAHTKAASFPRTKGIGLYNLACAHALKKQPKKALSFLEKAVRADFIDLEQFDSDSDLDSLRKMDRFKEIMTAAKNGGFPKKTDKPKKDPAKFDAKVLIGDWKVVKGERSGDEIGDDRLPPSIKITKDRLTIPTGDDNPFVFSYKVNADKKPIQIDFKIESGPVPEGTALGIILVKKDKLMLCYDSAGENRPKNFETKEGDGRFMFGLERNKK